MTDTKTLGAELKQKTEAEAAAAEAEEPEAEPTPAEPEPTPEDDEEGEADEQPAEPEQAGRKGKSPQQQFDAAMSAFGRKLRAIFEVEELTPAPHPGVVGFMLPGYSEPKTHEHYKRCDTCNGLGKVLTGAITGDDAKDWHVCPDTRCKGQGYWTKTAAVEAPPQTGPLAVQPPATGNGEFAEAPSWLGDPNLTPQV